VLAVVGTVVVMLVLLVAVLLIDVLALAVDVVLVIVATNAAISAWRPARSAVPRQWP
jgi:hypothetical protein